MSNIAFSSLYMSNFQPVFLVTLSLYVAIFQYNLHVPCTSISWYGILEFYVTFGCFCTERWYTNKPTNQWTKNHLYFTIIVWIEFWPLFRSWHPLSITFRYDVFLNSTLLLTKGKRDYWQLSKIVIIPISFSHIYWSTSLDTCSIKFIISSQCPDEAGRKICYWRIICESPFLSLNLSTIWSIWTLNIN